MEKVNLMGRVARNERGGAHTLTATTVFFTTPTKCDSYPRATDHGVKHNREQ